MNPIADIPAQDQERTKASLDGQSISVWLEESLTENTKDGYAHRLLKQRTESRDALTEKLKTRIEVAHEDAKRYLRRIVEDSLDPLGARGVDPAEGYPEQLPLSALKGYFGEILAAVVAEEYEHFDGNSWRVPAYPFRFHQIAFDYLERLRQGAPVPGAIPGRTGDDMLAFLLDENGRVCRTLVCEAKCTNTHDSGQIRKAHEQASSQIQRPVEIRRLVEILRGESDDESLTWQTALTRLFVEHDLDDYERYDMVVYVYGQAPIRTNTWMPIDRAHPAYEGARKLEAVELQLQEVDRFVQEVYDTMGKQ